MWQGKRKARLYLPFGHVIGWTKAWQGERKARLCLPFGHVIGWTKAWQGKRKAKYNNFHDFIIE